MAVNVIHNSFEHEITNLMQSSINVESKFSGVRRVIQKFEYNKSGGINGKTAAYLSDWEKLQEEYADIFLNTQLKANKLQTMIDVLIDKMRKDENQTQTIANYLPTYITDLEAFEIGDESAAATSRFLTLEQGVESFRQGIQMSINGSSTITDSSFTSNLAGIESKVQDLKNELNSTSKTLGLVGDHTMSPDASVSPPESGSEVLSRPSLPTFGSIYHALLDAARALQNDLADLNMEPSSPSEKIKSSISEFIHDYGTLSAALQKFATTTARSRPPGPSRSGSLTTATGSNSKSSESKRRMAGWSFKR